MIEFYKKHLNKRKGLLGMKKDEKKVLTFKKKAISKGNLILLNQDEIKTALSHFSVMLQYLLGKVNNIDNLIVISQQKSV